MKTALSILAAALVVFAGSVAAPDAVAEGSRAKAPSAFASMDADRDGKLNAAEHAGSAKQMFETMDANRDGKVTAAEMDASQQRITGRKARKGELSSAEKIKVVDADGDGVLTADEHAAGSRSMFEKMDADHDGVLSAKEFAAGHERMLRRTSSAN